MYWAYHSSSFLQVCSLLAEPVPPLPAPSRTWTCMRTSGLTKSEHNSLSQPVSRTVSSTSLAVREYVASSTTPHVSTLSHPRILRHRLAVSSTAAPTYAGLTIPTYSWMFVHAHPSGYHWQPLAAVTPTRTYAEVVVSYLFPSWTVRHTTKRALSTRTLQRCLSCLRLSSTLAPAHSTNGKCKGSPRDVPATSRYSLLRDC